MPLTDRLWIRQALFTCKSKLSAKLSNWWYPPEVSCTPAQPVPEQYFRREAVLVDAQKDVAVQLHLSKLSAQVTSFQGNYNRVRLVLDVNCYYYLAGEYMDCLDCKGTYISWDARMLEQLSAGVRARFPVVLTHKYACDRAVIALLRSRTLGNSPSALQQTLREMHSEEWLRNQLCYLSDCQQHRQGRLSMCQSAPQYPEAPSFRHVPSAPWFLACYVREVCSRLPELKAAATSIFGRVIKIDSSKKVLKKLQGAAANSASWVTSVGNEIGQVVVCVLTTSEDLSSLQPLADGLINRYANAGQEPPSVLYVDRDCCSQSGPSKFARLFSDWNMMMVRLDVWHFMRRMARGCTSESHPLYGTFMARLSDCTFEWDADDFNNLLAAKQREMAKVGVSNASQRAVRKAIARDELARHCRRRTRGTEQTNRLIEDMILSLTTLQTCWASVYSETKCLRFGKRKNGTLLVCKIRPEYPCIQRSDPLPKATWFCPFTVVLVVRRRLRTSISIWPASFPAQLQMP
jgi:hypothetical protein